MITDHQRWIIAAGIAATTILYIILKRRNRR